MIIVIIYIYIYFGGVNHLIFLYSFFLSQSPSPISFSIEKKNPADPLLLFLVSGSALCSPAPVYPSSSPSLSTSASNPSRSLGGLGVLWFDIVITPTSPPHTHTLTATHRQPPPPTPSTPNIHVHLKLFLAIKDLTNYRIVNDDLLMSEDIGMTKENVKTLRRALERHFYEWETWGTLWRNLQFAFCFLFLRCRTFFDLISDKLLSARHKMTNSAKISSRVLPVRFGPEGGLPFSHFKYRMCMSAS